MKPTRMYSLHAIWFLLHGTQIKIQIIGITVIIVLILEVPVMQITVAQCNGLYMIARIMTVHTTQSKCFLLYRRQIAKKIFGIISIDIHIQFHAVSDPPRPSTVSSFLSSNLVFILERSICISRQERQTEHLEQHLQI